MAKRILHLTIHADDPEFDTAELTKILDKAPDWVRYAPDCWLLYTSLSARAWYRRLQPLIREQDEILVTPIDIDEYEGYLRKSVLKWMDKFSKQTSSVE